MPSVNIILESFSRPPYALPESRGITLYIDGEPAFEAYFGNWASMEGLALELAKLSDSGARLVFTHEAT